MLKKTLAMAFWTAYLPTQKIRKGEQNDKEKEKKNSQENLKEQSDGESRQNEMWTEQDLS